jgi:SPX domain protein involved in polyphosphate accumulation
VVQSDLAAIRTFNRYELKYLVDQRLLARVRPELSARLDHDTHGDLGSYPLWSRYYDTYDLRCYWEKIDGIKFRRKLRIRHYGGPHTLSADTLVWVEIKQRFNRVTQKRRARLRYDQAVELCAGHEIAGCETADGAVVEEVQRLVGDFDLRPSTAIGYTREALVGREEDAGLRVTFDARIRARDRDLDLSVEGENRFIVHPDLTVLEVKVNERVPYWLTELIARNNLQLVRISKYCQSVDAFERKPRSLFHSVDEDLYEMESGS